MADSVDYTDTAVFPVFASKTALLQALSDPANNFQLNSLEFLARLANTDTSTFADPTAALTVLSGDNESGGG